MNSVWMDDADRVSFDSLKKSIKTDVLIVGGGITGILCAHMLKKAGVDCILAEADCICGGITQNTTAKITLGHGLIYDKLIRRFGSEKARMYLQAQIKASKEYELLCQSIQCEYQKKDSYVYSMTSRDKVERETVALKLLGVNAEISNAPSIPFETAGAVRVREQAQFNPLSFAFGIARELPIYEHTKILELSPNRAVTERGDIVCEKIIVATHFPVLNKHGGYFLKLYQHRSYVLALQNAADVDGMYVDENDKGLSFRNYKDNLLLGGGSHRTGKQGGNWRELERLAKKYYPDASITQRWATQDCMTLDRVPYIGLYSPSTPNLYVATGFNKWGMTSAMISAIILTDMIRGKANELAPVFYPARSVLRPQLAVNAFESVIGLLTPTAPRCPHLGCALKYNKAENSWDCPCHGSRFSENGKLINNPATDDKEGMKR